MSEIIMTPVLDKNGNIVQFIRKEPTIIYGPMPKEQDAVDKLRERCQLQNALLYIDYKSQALFEPGEEI